ncbi:methyltransferase family protein [Paludibaculum fermentans]|uniref:Isoprenylcysteine carboxylmethyltransferase family protein n=1 Tax=Paludibaculum fermentans TaxID=1473598 RepID=A0A7S7NY10_PALFE|nr:isoprenylcysteine carboxylmethyltransferase family protein [Paludibaculum fermentans]QOY91274.1 isoprenylcysteine carboxylmethyltransferase family protein [Paludibaculum fermentans]
MRLPDIKQLASIVFSLAITAACLFGAAGRLAWQNAWVLLGLSLLTGLAFTLGRDPELAAERRNVKEGKSWDKLLVGITVLLGPMAVWITAGLDIRFHWSKAVSTVAVSLGIAAAVLSAALIAWAMRTNRFFSSVVRIQKDRGHTVIDGGPYRFIRHPGYAGSAVYLLATPLILGSTWALLPAAATALVMMLRTSLEDATLHNELDGYADYARRVRYRLCPAIW